MKKIMIVIVVLTISGLAFANDFEKFKSQNLIELLDTQVGIVVVPMSKPAKKNDSAIDSVVTKSVQPKYFLQVSDRGDFICADKSGIEGYNEITVSELKANSRTGECADLVAAKLSNTDLSGANLNGANLIVANLSGANLSGAHLSGANLKVANLSGANLSDVHLYRANLSGADLSMVDLSGICMDTAIFEKTNLKGAKYNDKTILPFGDAEAKRRGMIKVE